MGKLGHDGSGGNISNFTQEHVRAAWNSTLNSESFTQIGQPSYNQLVSNHVICLTSAPPIPKALSLSEMWNVGQKMLPVKVPLAENEKGEREINEREIYYFCRRRRPCFFHIGRFPFLSIVRTTAAPPFTGFPWLVVTYPDNIIGILGLQNFSKVLGWLLLKNCKLSREFGENQPATLAIAKQTD